MPRVWRIRLLVCAVAALAAAGCVERRFRIETDPPGAEVFVDFLSVGRSPVEIPFTHYGERQVEVRLDGYDTRRERVRLAPPWYQWFPLELVSEFVVPWTIVDRHRAAVKLEPASYDEEGLLKRAEEARACRWTD